MKNTLFTSLIVVVLLSATGCYQSPLFEELLPPMPPTVIKTEACFSDDGMTLIVAHPQDEFFYTAKHLYNVTWYQKNRFLRSGTRLPCVSAGKYRAEITFYQYGETRILTYEIPAENVED